MFDVWGASESYGLYNGKLCLSVGRKIWRTEKRSAWVRGSIAISVRKIIEKKIEGSRGERGIMKKSLR